ncbi:acyltransferase domain-containing protein [Flavobacterium collinsii]|uniref:PKS/mFAS DH domain-containing protein n=1 Tax=Flavobacterium collinsii TaxID=1114861 RepID=A0ABN7EPK3_9FLAO|nr:acyltransferase domain-containing protein [Flavobacterium collinsii]CAA9202060.1 hypothetical protein FLACOL7796_04077 [Flavobacterium collinsii]
MQHTEIKESKTTLFLFRYKDLKSLCETLLSLIEKLNTSTNLFELTIQVCQNDYQHTGGLLITANSNTELLAKINSIIEKINAGQPLKSQLSQKIHHAVLTNIPSKAVFLFPGFGSEHPSMLSGLENKFPASEKWLSMAKKILDIPVEESAAFLEKTMIDKFSKKEGSLMDKGSLGIITSLAFCDILNKLNLSCNAMLGHSNGENAAIIASGIVQFNNDDEILNNIKRIINVPILLDHQYEGQYLAINNYSAQKLDALLKTYQEDVYLAMKNCPNQLVIYVLKDKLTEVKNRLSEERAMAFQLYTDHPYHTPFYSKQAKEVRNIYANLFLTKAVTPLYSCVDAIPFPEDREMVVDKAIAQWVDTVKFEDTINKLYSEGYNTFIEVGPNNKLVNFVKDTLKNKPVVILNTNLPDKDNFNTFSELCALLWINGVNTDIDFFNSNTKKPEKEIPQQPAAINTTINNNNQNVLIFKKHQELMQHFLQVQEQSWNMFKQEIQKRQNPQLKNNIEFIPSHFPLLAKQSNHTNGKMYIEKQYDLHSYPFFKDHAMGEKLAVIAFTVSLEITAEAALLYSRSQFKVTGIENASGHSWLALEKGKIDVGIEVNAIGTNKTEVVIYELNKSSGNKKKAFEATVILSPNYTIAPSYQPIQHSENTISLKPAANFYKEDLFHGPYYTGIEKVTNLNSKELTAVMRMPVLKEAFSNISNPVFQIPAALLDCSGQLAAYWLMNHNTIDFAVFPFSMKSYKQFAPFQAEGTSLKCDVKISKMQSIVEAQFCYYDNENRLLAQIEGFKMMLYQHPLIPAILMNTIQQEQTEQLLTPEFLLEAGGIWGRALAAIILDTKEYENWLSLTKIENQIDYLINKIQIKSLTI